MNTEQFLRLVLPASGVYFGAVPAPEYGFKHKAFSDIAALASWAQSVSDRGHNAYFACSQFAEERYYDEAKEKWRRRTHDNAVSAKAQWIDIDCGNEEYPTQADGIKALVAFCKSTGLPRPHLLVNSGNGIHGYWLFDREVERDVWAKSAKLFKSIVQHFKFAQTDTTRTADIASVLRPVGTNNDKTHKGLGVKAVKLIGAVNTTPLSYSDWVRSLIRIRAEHNVSLPKDTKAKESRNSDLAGGQEYPPSFADRIADRCQQIRVFREYRGANQTEPVWRACLGVMAYCEDGMEKAHAWSSGYEGYDEDETLNKLNTWKQNAGPTTCAHFTAHNDEGCKGCKHAGKISSPILLGRPDPEHKTEQVVDQVVEVAGKEVIQKVVEDIPDFPEHVKKKFRWDGKALCAKVENEEGDSWVPCCYQLPVPQYVFFDSDSLSYKLHMKIWVRPFVWREADINAKALSQGGTALLGELGGVAGIVPRGTGVQLVEYMRTWAETIQMTSEEVNMHTHYGWYDDGSFLLGATKYLPDGTTKQVRLNETLSPSAKDHVPTGSLEKYIELIDRAYNREGHQVYQFTWLASFATPLIALAHAGTIGIPLVGWSKESGYGKTTAAMAGIGVWGNPHAPNQVANANKVTDYALGVMAGMRRNLPVCLDETTMWEAKRLAQFAYDYSDGRPKVQGKASGGLRDNSNLQWGNTIYLTTNKSVVNAMVSCIPDCGPQVARVWEYAYSVDHTKTLGRAEGSRLFSELWNHYAVAGDAFLRYAVPNQDKIRQAILKAADAFAKETSVDKSARFWLLVAGAVWVAYLVTKKLGMQEFNGNELREWIVRHLSQMQVSAADAVREPIEAFADLMSELQSGLIVTDTEGDARANKPAIYAPGFGPPRGEVTGRVLVQDKKVYLSQTAVRRWCVDHNTSYNEIEAALKSHGYLTRITRLSIAKGTNIPLPQTRCLVLNWGNYANHLVAVPMEGNTLEQVNAA